MNKRDLSERDICTKYITPAVVNAGWDIQWQIREEVGFTKGRIIVRGKLVTRGKAQRADYILYYKPNIPIALIEAKDNNNRSAAGLFLEGDAFLFHDRTSQSSQTATAPELLLKRRKEGELNYRFQRLDPFNRIFI
jgi:type I restriction enzyme R subunit